MSESDAPTSTQGSLLDVIRASGVELSREGAIWTGDCPFHKDQNSALMVDPEKGHWQCDGVCQTGGDIDTWIEKSKALHGNSGGNAPIQDECRVNDSSYVAQSEKSSSELLPQFSSKSDDQKTLNHVAEYYHQSLKKSPGALEYLRKRKIDHPKVIEHFKLGFCDRSLGTKLPLKNRKEGAAIRGQLQQLGILKSSGHELFRGSVVIPVISNGQITQMYGRKVLQNLRPGTAKHVMLPHECVDLFNIEAVKSSDELIVCQSFIDALTFWCAGYRNVTCAVGGFAFSDTHVNLLKIYGTKRVLIAFGVSSEGNSTAETLANKLNAAGIDAFLIRFPVGLDVNAYAQKSKSSQAALGDAIRQAQWLGKGEQLPDRDYEQADQSEELIVSGSGEELDTAKEGSGDQSDIERCPPTALEVDVPLPARVEPRPPDSLDVQIKDNELIIQFEQRRYRIRGFEKNLSYDQLKLNLLVSQGEGLHVDTFDFYATKPRASFIRQAAIELGVKEELIKKELTQILLKLEILQDENIREVLKPKVIEKTLSERERAEAQTLLESPDLVQRILEDFKQCGLVGEDTNKLVAYLAVLSRKLDKPLAIMVQSTSAAGKSALMDAVLNFMPDEECVQYSAITGQSLFYMGNVNLRHKVLAISEEEGASNASYALKLLQSEGRLTIASTGKDPISGRHTTHEYRVDGPVMIFSTTTAIDIDEELLNRCLVLTVNEDQAQTEAIHQWQRYEETLEGLLANQAREDVLRLHRNAQRLLRPLRVVNPYAMHLTFLSDKTRTRRDHRKYLTLIRSIALLHQYQREVKTSYYRNREIEYIEVTLEDIDLANKIAHEVLGRSLDELPPQTRHLLTLIDQMVSERCPGSPGSRRGVRFTRRDIREYTGWGVTQLKVHLQRLETMEYLLIHRGGRGQQRIYELLYNSEGKDGSSFLMGLMDVDSLRRSASGSNKSDSGQHQVGPMSASGLAKDIDKNTNNINALPSFSANLLITSSGVVIPTEIHTANSSSTSHER
jgi:DNA primase